MDFSSINFLAVFVAAFAAFFIGFLWHGPVFGKQWVKMMGISQAEVKAMQAKGMGPMVPRMLGALGQQLVIATVIAHFASALGIASVEQAVMFALLLWFGFIATVLLNSVLWENRKMNLYLFNISYQLVAYVVVTLIVVLWR